MMLRTGLAAFGVLLVAACGAGERAPAEPAESASGSAAPSAEPASPAASAPSANPAQGDFDWDAWAALVNESPCNWLPQEAIDTLLGPGLTATPSLTATETGCIWTAADGTRVFSASVQTFDSAANTVNEREGQVRDAGSGGPFKLVGKPGGTVTSIHRTDRIYGYMFANSDEETAVVFLNGARVMNDPPEVRTAKRERLVAFIEALEARYGL